MYLSKRVAAVGLAVLLVVGGVVSFSSTQTAAQGRLEPREDDETFESTDDDEADEDNEEEDEDARDYDEDDLPVPVLFGAPIDELYSTFGDPRGGGTREHEGFDILVPAGTPIVSPTEAEVRRIGTYRGAGRFVILETDDERELRFYHMEDQADYLDEGDDVEVGDLLGFVGSSGNAVASAPHLHLEIRDDNDLRDPFDVITTDFTLAEKMEILDGVLDDADDADELAEFLTEEYATVFARAARSGLDVPEDVRAELPDDFSVRSVPSQDLSVGARGAAVSELQQILIDEGTLTRVVSPTGYFGPITKAALAEFQQEAGITPASGIFGPKTRAYLGGDSRQAAPTEETLRARVERLTEQVERLREALGS